MNWPWRRPEVRSSYTEQIVSRLVAAASGATGDGAALGAVEVAARLWGAGLASARVTPTGGALDAVSATVLDSIGRSLCRFGESLHVIDVRHGRATLTPCGQWTVQGGDDPASWRYLCTLNGPSTARTITLPAESCLHLRYSPHPSRPWAGRSPLVLAHATGRAATLLERATSAEFSFTQQQILSPKRNQNEYGTDSFSPDLIEKIVQAFAASTGSDALVVPGDLEPRRLGPTPPDSFATLRELLENSMLALHGIPPSLIRSTGTGTALREAMRQLGATLIRPLAELVTQELKEKLDPDAELDLSALRSADLAGSARAVGSLTNAGMTLADAREVAGL